MSDSQGAKANKNGKILEDSITPALESRNFLVIEFKKYIKNEDYYNSLPRVAVKGFPFTTVYETNGKTEYVLLGTDLKERIRIECKWQQAAGSVDEKFPYMYLNSVYKYPEKTVIFVIDGGGYKAGSRLWVGKQIQNNWLNENHHKNLYLFTLAEMIAFINKNFS